MKRSIAFIAAAGFVLATAVGVATWSPTEDIPPGLGEQFQPVTAASPEMTASITKINNPGVSPQITDRGMFVIEKSTSAPTSASNTWNARIERGCPQN